jgi:plastocyanin
LKPTAIRSRRRLCAVLCLALTAEAGAVTLSGEAYDDSGTPLADVVVTAAPMQGGRPPSARPAPARIDLDQKGREFMPHVLPVRVGTPVYFPNGDEIQHHVYSFSPAKRFEIKLYTGTPSEPVVFDRPGVAALGCNIHDWMLAFVYVTDAPHFTKTDATGRWTLEVPEGDYRLTLWHPHAASPRSLPGETVAAVTAQTFRHVIALKPRRPDGKPPANLQNQFYSDGF